MKWLATLLLAAALGPCAGLADDSFAGRRHILHLSGLGDLWGAVTLPTPDPTAPIPAPRASSCFGDCNLDGVVTSGEILTGVRIALGASAITDCPATDGDGDEGVTVDEVIRAILAGRAACGTVSRRFPLGAYFWPDHAYGQTGSALGDLADFGLNTVVAYYDYVKPDVPPYSGQPDCRGLAAEAELLGIDFFIGSPRGAQVRLLDDMELGERLQATVDCVGRSPRYRGWMFDEPELTGYDRATLERAVGVLRRVDPEGAVWINFNPYATDDQLQDLGGSADVFGFDIYPIREGNGSPFPNRPLRTVGALTARAREFAPIGAEVWMIVQAFGYSDLPNEGGRGRRPTPHELRFMVYDAMIHGARGVIFFGSHQLRHMIPLEEPVWSLGVRSLVRELNTIRPFLLDSDTPDDVTGGPASLAIRGMRLGREEILIAANTDAEPVQAFIQFGAAIEDAEEMFENRRPRLEERAIWDDFAPYDVHVYRVWR